MRRGDLAMTGFDAIRRHDKALGGKVWLVAGLCPSRAFARRGHFPVALTPHATDKTDCPSYVGPSLDDEALDAVGARISSACHCCPLNSKHVLVVLALDWWYRLDVTIIRYDLERRGRLYDE